MSPLPGKFNQAIDDFQLSAVNSETDAHLEKENAGPARHASPDKQFCVFRCGRERFCLPVLDVEEVVEWPLLTRIPLSSAYLMGIFNLRGTIVPLVDIAMTEGRRPGLLPKHVVVASYHEGEHHDDMRVGIAADEVIGTFSVTSDAMLEQGPDNVPHCVGMLRHDDRLALMIDLRRLLEVFPGPAI
ncbi:MAG: chemotaxis protein CheW [Acidobacteriia bacterium]|nr:chemotaxis protein CheW [Terriglobia bacterium]